jgi:SAM-dependent methyltransferase
MKPLYATPEQAYDAYREAPARFFERYHEEHFDERRLISPKWTWGQTKYHYNLVENGIIDLLGALGDEAGVGDVLDVGSGTGHWIDFYADVLEARSVVGVDFSEVASVALAARYARRENLTIQRMDVSEHRADFDGAFCVINAIGVMFHIVDDGRWSAAIGNLGRYLRPGGVAIIGGDFGPETQELGVMRRTRSLEQWERTLAGFGLEVCDLRRFDWAKGGINEGLKNNLLAFRHRG